MAPKHRNKRLAPVRLHPRFVPWLDFGRMVMNPQVAGCADAYLVRDFGLENGGNITDVVICVQLLPYVC